MSDTAKKHDAVRAHILSDPHTVLEDQDVMRALISADTAALGANVVDLRSIALERLEARLNRLEETHRSVIAAAYDNLAGTNQIHRAVLALLQQDEFPGFLELVSTQLAGMLKVDTLRLCLETPVANAESEDALSLEFGEGVEFLAPGEIRHYLTLGRNVTGRSVTLRPLQHKAGKIYGAVAPDLKSEALLLLDLGPGNLPGMLALGSQDPGQFDPAQGSDLLDFFARVFERSLQRWLT